jgi:pimeloyl-ACP methyl ester carboxylesterase
MRKKSIEYGGTSLNYHTTGEGFPIVLLHGFAEDHTIWQEQIKYLSADYYVIAVDLFGAGDSAHLEKNAVRIDDYASAIKQIVVAEKI